MVGDLLYILLALLLGLALGGVLAYRFLIRKKQMRPPLYSRFNRIVPVSRRRTTTQDTPQKGRNSAAKPLRSAHAAPGPTSCPSDGIPLSEFLKEETPALHDLRRNLLLKTGNDPVRCESLIDYERKKRPGLSEIELIQSAIDRWEQDNR